MSFPIPIDGESMTAYWDRIAYDEFGISRDEEKLKTEVLALKDPTKYLEMMTNAKRRAAKTLADPFAEIFKQLVAAKFTEDEAKEYALKYVKALYPRVAIAAEMRLPTYLLEKGMKQMQEQAQWRSKFYGVPKPPPLAGAKKGAPPPGPAPPAAPVVVKPEPVEVKQEPVPQVEIKPEPAEVKPEPVVVKPEPIEVKQEPGRKDDELDLDAPPEVEELDLDAPLEEEEEKEAKIASESTPESDVEDESDIEEAAEAHEKGSEKGDEEDEEGEEEEPEGELIKTELFKAYPLSPYMRSQVLSFISEEDIEDDHYPSGKKWSKLLKDQKIEKTYDWLVKYNVELSIEKFVENVVPIKDSVDTSYFGPLLQAVEDAGLLDLPSRRTYVSAGKVYEARIREAISEILAKTDTTEVNTIFYRLYDQVKDKTVDASKLEFLRHVGKLFGVKFTDLPKAITKKYLSTEDMGQIAELMSKVTRYYKKAGSHK